jgi:hypothetical protein
MARSTKISIQNWGTHWGTTSETSPVIQHIDLAEPAIFTTSSVKTIPRVGASAIEEIFTEDCV